ncbi:MAG: sarcosine oxidase subunit gamma SoxG, partial [Desulfobacterales bacterium]
MESIKRCSPARFDGQPLNTEQQGDWTVVLEYEAEGKEPWVIDLSHRARWDLQDADISKQQPWGINIPETPGQCVLENGVLINRMNRTQASIWHLFGEDLAVPDDQAFTDVTDATVFLVL